MKMTLQTIHSLPQKYLQYLGICIDWWVAVVVMGAGGVKSISCKTQLWLREAFKTKNVTKMWKKSKGWGGSAPKIKESKIQIVDYFEYGKK